MTTLRDVYNLPHKVLPLSGFPFREIWVPEISCNGDIFSHENISEFVSENRVEVREIIRHHQGDDYGVEMVSVWFDKKPVFIVQCSGEDLRGVDNRWITDEKLFISLRLYLESKLRCYRSDVVDIDSTVSDRDLFCIAGDDFRRSFGFPIEEPTPGVNFLGQVTISCIPYCVFSFSSEHESQPVYLCHENIALMLDRLVSIDDLNQASDRNLKNIDAHGKYFLYHHCEIPRNKKMSFF